MTSASAPASPWIHGPDLEGHLARSQASPAAAAFARDLARDGLAIVNLGEDMAALCDQAVAETEPMFRDDKVGRVHEAWRRSPAVRAIAARPDLKALLALAYGREPFAFQTLSFMRGSQQDPHADSMHFQSGPAGFMCGVWVALEDVRPEAGPLIYYPGSHRLSPKARGAGDATIDTYEQHHGDALTADLEAHGLVARPAMLRKGQVAVWAADLAHGGSPILDPASTRRSLVIHFYFEDCLYYTPMHSKAGKLAMRLPARVGGGWVWPRRDGRRAPVPIKALGAAVINRLLRRTPGLLTARRAFDLHQAGRNAEAAELCERLTGDDPGSVAAWHLLGVARLALGRTQEALVALDQALVLDKSRPGIWSARAASLVALGRDVEAVDACGDALALDPDNVLVLNALGVALRRLGRADEALAAYDRALAISPDFSDALCNRGVALSDLGRFGEALAAHDRAVAAAPRGVQALSNRAALLTVLGRPGEAGRDLEAVVALDPRHPRVLGDLLHVRRQVCDWRDDMALRRAVRGELEAGRSAISPFAALATFDDPALHRLVASLASPVAVPSPDPPPPLPGGRVLVAYLSADLHDHATARLMAGLLEAHDRERFEIIALSYGPDLGGALRERIDATFERRIDVRRMSDAQVAALARELEVEILIDLKGYTQDGRPGILAHRAAPVQVSWLGYPGTLAASYVDYVIADAVVLPRGAEADWSEAVVRLPLYQPNDALAPVGATVTRADAGLPDGAFVFACLNNPAKITPETFAVWMEILKRAPSAVLWLYEGSPGVSANLRTEARAAGIDPDRLVFAAPAPHAEHLARQALADLMLDTWPYGAHTTASDALRMGAPLLTLPGKSFASRVGASLLTGLDLPELIAADVADYVAVAVRLAGDRAALDALNARLAKALREAPVFDPVAFAGWLEAAFERMTLCLVAGLPHDGFDIDPV